MSQFLEHIRTHFNILHDGDYLSLTLINPNLNLDIIKDIKDQFRLMTYIKRQEITIIESVNFDDELLIALASSLPHSLQELSLDFTGCQSLKGSGFLDLFERISEMQGLTKLKFDFSEVYDINDIVVEGLSMLLESLSNLKDFYLDLYQVDQISQDGYLLLAEAMANIPHVNHLYLDLSANPNLLEDSLQLLFGNLPNQLQSFGFRIIDIEHIGGGSFFRLSQWFAKNHQKLKQIKLTISTFSNLNQKGIFSLFKGLSQCQNLQNLTLNISNINLPQKILSYLNFSDKLKNLNIDISCNTALTDRDLLNLMNKLPKNGSLREISLNFDMCKRITQEGIEQFVQYLTQSFGLMKLALPDRIYSQQFLQNTVDIVEKSKCSNCLLIFEVNLQQQVIKFSKKWMNFLKKLTNKRQIFFAHYKLDQCEFLRNNKKMIMSFFKGLHVE